MICRVTSEHQFSAAIREEIKFAVSKNTSPLRICAQPYLDFKISVIFISRWAGRPARVRRRREFPRGEISSIHASGHRDQVREIHLTSFSGESPRLDLSWILYVFIQPLIIIIINVSNVKFIKAITISKHNNHHSSALDTESHGNWRKLSNTFLTPWPAV